MLWKRRDPLRSGQGAGGWVAISTQIATPDRRKDLHATQNALYLNDKDVGGR